MEIDESKFFHRKYHRGAWRGGHWVFGGIECGSNRGFLVKVEQRDANTLLPLIEDWILLGPRLCPMVGVRIITSTKLEVEFIRTTLSSIRIILLIPLIVLYIPKYREYVEQSKTYFSSYIWNITSTL